MNGLYVLKSYTPGFFSTTFQLMSVRAHVTPTVETCGGCPSVGGMWMATPNGESAN
ncbi:hypothetical protein GCM10009839_13380 [Catenulispora yoronensis]|uniref:Uncharacterized protein n=1 Tax=Catenulispora yoronensis TaxID=450799 RepID=A0ABP5FA81_9ACTN